MWRNNNNTKMHGIAEIGPNVPAFLVKLWKLVEDPECDLIYWSESGMSFIIVAQARFAREVLPLHYKHNNMASFIRQLNMYDFHKIASVESGGLKSDKDEMEFAHQYFIKDHPYLLENIKRKLSNPKSGAVASDNLASSAVKNGSQSEIFAKVLSDVNILKGKQESWDARLSAMKRENEALWRELAVFRQKHLKQEQIINRLIHFIVTIVQPSRKVPIRRKFPLMLNGTQQVKKITKINDNCESQLNHGSPPGPTIHEIDSDVFIGGNEKKLSNSSGGEEFISTDFSESTEDYDVISPMEAQITSDPVSSNSTSSNTKDHASDWLEIVLTEDDDMITNPLTPIDPAKVNPTVAAATLKHLESNKKITAPVTIKIPSIVSSEGGKKKTVPEKKIIYLAEVKQPGKTVRKRPIKPPISKDEINKNKSRPVAAKSDEVGDSTDALLDLICNEGTSSSKILTIPPKIIVSGKRKLSTSANSSDGAKIPNKRQNIEKKTVKEASSETYSPITIGDNLDNTLEYNLFDYEEVGCEDGAKDNGGEKQSVSDDSFWKLESLYNGSIGVNELIEEVDEEEKDIREGKEKTGKNFIDKNSSEINLCDVGETDMDLLKMSEKNESENSGAVVDFEPGSLAVVCQSDSSGKEELSRELSSHVDNVQGEIDYLKEVLKGEGYNLDMNSILGYFNDDPLSFGILPPAEEDAKEKENDQGVTGKEVMTYGTPPNLMDLVDLFGSTGTVQDWSNVLSPTSPTISELATPAPSPSPSSLGKSIKRRKI